MDSDRFLYDLYKDYYEKGMNDFNNEDLKNAYRNFYNAADALLKLSQKSYGDLKSRRFSRARELIELADRIKEKHKENLNKSSNNDNSVNDELDNEIKDQNTIDDSIINEDEKFEIDEELLKESIDELNSLIGLSEVKNSMIKIINQTRVFRERKKRGLQTPDLSYHMIFTGNPGTGKTTVARILGKIFNSLGILSKGHLVEVSREDLVGAYIGWTEMKTKKVLEKARGGILFIDEAYSLANESSNDFGAQAIDVINKFMEDHRNNIIVIAAGYNDDMKAFVEMNEGLKSRFTNTIHFNDYSPQELFDILLLTTEKYGFILSDSAKNASIEYLSNLSDEEKNGNARNIRNILESAILMQCSRIKNLENCSNDDLITIEAEDFPFYNQI